MTVVFISRPTDVLVQYLAKNPSKKGQFYMGRMAMALELLTQMRILDQLPLTDQSTAIFATLQAFLIDQGLFDQATELYEELDAWRTPKFVAEHGGDKPTDPSSSSVSSVVAPEGSLSRVRKARTLLQEHRGPGDQPIAGSEGSPAEEAEST